jgi:hypothetical protein
MSEFSDRSPWPPARNNPLLRTGARDVFGGDDTSKSDTRIKLLKLFPGQHNDTLGGQLITREDEKYEALSYYWGPRTESPPRIRILAKNEWSSLPITQNLESALRHLRLEKHDRKLWIDALCIDQDNEVEKSEQIPIMGRIYSQATNVCVWLGPKSDTSPLAFDLIRRILDLHTFDRLVDERNTRDWAALSELMRRPWFSRRWVVQEIAFAKFATVHCGPNIISWPELADAVALFGSRGPEIAQLFKRDKSFGHRADFLGDVEALGANRLVQTIGKLFRRADDGQRLEKLLSLESLVSNLSAFNAAKPHDIIYAVLSLANDTVTSAKASETVPRRVSITGPIIREPVGPRQGAQKSGVTFTNAVNKPGHSQHRSMDAVKEEAVKNESETAENKSLPNREVSHFAGDVHNDNDATTSAALTERSNPAATNASDHPLKPSTVAAAHAPHQSREFPREAIDSITNLGFTREEAIHTLELEDGNIKLARDRLVKEKENETKKRVVKILQSKVENKTFHVDYKNKRFYEVCKDFITFTIKSSKSLDMLCRPWAPDREDLPPEDKGHLPSWICTLSRSPFRPRPDGNFGRVNADLLVGMPDPGGRTYTASANTKPEFCKFGEGRDHRSLLVHGFVLDKIEEIRIPAIEGNVPHDWLELGGWNDTTQDPPESFWRTLVADRDEKRHNPPSYYRRACKHAFAQRVERGSLNTERLIGNEDSRIMVNFLKRVQAVVWMRSLVKTKRDHQLGLAPNGVRVGDYICILRGCSVPVLMREATDPAMDFFRGPNQYSGRRLLVGEEVHPSTNAVPQTPMSPTTVKNPSYRFTKQVPCHLIGECYIHGMMDGEAFKVRDAKKIDEWEFELQ